MSGPCDPPIRCDHRLRAVLQDRLAGFEVRAHVDPARRGAAVAVAVLEEGPGAHLAGMDAPTSWSDRAALLLTRRNETLRNHAGQWALPGGRIDAGETAEQAALRELAEEVGLVLEPCCVLGRLDDFATRSGYVITPVVVWAGRAATLLANPDEVASLHRIPAEEFLRPDAPMLDMEDGHAQPVLRMPVGDTWIAAPTAAVLYQFRELCLCDRPTRVGHFEQPSFAWR